MRWAANIIIWNHFSKSNHSSVLISQVSYPSNHKSYMVQSLSLFLALHWNQTRATSQWAVCLFTSSFRRHKTILFVSFKSWFTWQATEAVVRFKTITVAQQSAALCPISNAVFIYIIILSTQRWRVRRRSQESIYVCACGRGVDFLTVRIMKRLLLLLQLQQLRLTADEETSRQWRRSVFKSGMSLPFASQPSLPSFPSPSFFLRTPAP